MNVILVPIYSIEILYEAQKETDQFSQEQLIGQEYNICHKLYVFLIVTRYVKNSYWYYESLKNEMEEV
jgi:hypothetical protein